MAQYDLTNNDGTPFKTEAEKNFAAQPLRSETDVLIEKALDGDGLSMMTVATVLALTVVIAVGLWKIGSWLFVAKQSE